MSLKFRREKTCRACSGENRENVTMLLLAGRLFKRFDSSIGFCFSRSEESTADSRCLIRSPRSMEMG